MITIIGLGAGDFEQLPLGIYRIMTSGKNVFVRTEKHPVIADLDREGFSDFTSFDKIYEECDDFESVYIRIAKILIEASQKTDIIYAVPGHPMVAERVVQLILEADVEVEIKGGQSFLDAMFTSLKIDPIEGFQLLDATGFDPSDISLKQHVIFCQVYDADVASNVKLPLLEMLPYNYEAVIITAAGTSEEFIKKVPLCELDHEITLSNLTSVYIPPVPKELLYFEFSSLRETVKILRGENGCPWDKKQTHQSLKKNLIEETQELLEALDGKDDDHIIEELGDVLLQVMLHSQIGEDEGWFNIGDVISVLNKKLIRRHPHVFGDLKANSPEEAMAIWQKMKKEE